MNKEQTECLIECSKQTYLSASSYLKGSKLFEDKNHEAVTAVVTGVLSALSGDIVEEEFESYLEFICDIVRKNYEIITENERKVKKMNDEERVQPSENLQKFFNNILALKDEIKAEYEESNLECVLNIYNKLDRLIKRNEE